jgi:hypothetical protein
MTPADCYAPEVGAMTYYPTRRTRKWIQVNGDYVAQVESPRLCCRK